MAGSSSRLRQRVHSDSRPTGRAGQGNAVSTGQGRGVEAGQGGWEWKGRTTVPVDLRLGDFRGVWAAFGLEEDAECQAEGEEGREDGGLWVLVELFLDALEEVLEEIEQTTVDRLGHPLCVCVFVSVCVCVCVCVCEMHMYL